MKKMLSELGKKVEKVLYSIRELKDEFPEQDYIFETYDKEIDCEFRVGSEKSIVGGMSNNIVWNDKELEVAE